MYYIKISTLANQTHSSQSLLERGDARDVRKKRFSRSRYTRRLAIYFRRQRYAAYVSEQFQQ
jgi:hypothetical protein